MSSTLALAATPDRATTRRRHSLRTAAVLAAVVATTAAVGAGAAPANAAEAMYPAAGGPWTSIVETAANASFSMTVQSMWAALTVLPNSSEIHVGQIVKQYVQAGR